MEERFERIERDLAVAAAIVKLVVERRERLAERQDRLADRQERLAVRQEHFAESQAGHIATWKRLVDAVDRPACDSRLRTFEERLRAIEEKQ